MAATREDIRGWIERGQKQGATHLIVVCDTWDWDDFPVFVQPSQNVREVEKGHMGNMERVMEVYNLSKDIEEQLNQDRSFNY